MFYHRVVMEHENKDSESSPPKSVFVVKCDSAAFNGTEAVFADVQVEEVRLSKRSALPQFENFREDE